MSEAMAERGFSEDRGIASAWKYVALAYTIAWVIWILCIQLRAPEMVLILGASGPGVAAMILSRRSLVRLQRPSWGRMLLFLLAGAGCSGILSLHYEWRGNSANHFHWDPWTLIPSIAPTLILCSAASRDQGTRKLTRSLVGFTRWSLIALLIFPGIVILGDLLAVKLRQPLVMPLGHGSINGDIGAAVVFFLYNVFFVAILEEPGWRGFLLPHLQSRWSPLGSTLFVWLAWALWHAPLDLLRPDRFSLVQYLEIRVVFLIPIAVILTWIYNKARSVQACAVFHASMNTFPFVLPYWMPSFALLFAIAGTVIVSDRMWRRRANDREMRHENMLT